MYPHRRQPAPGLVQLTRRIQMKWRIVPLHRIPLRLPSRQATLQKFDSRKFHRQRPLQNHPAGVFAHARAIHHRILVLRKRRSVLDNLLRGNPCRSRDNLRMRQQIQRLPHIEHQHLRLGLQQRMQRLRLDAVRLQFPPLPHPPSPVKSHQQHAKSNHADRNQPHSASSRFLDYQILDAAPEILSEDLRGPRAARSRGRI